MAKVDEIVEEIKSQGSESIKKVLVKHGAVEPFYGTKVEYLKKIQKKIKHDHELAMQLYDTGISEAMYLAALVGDGAKMTTAQLNTWLKKAPWSMISEYSVPWIASENPKGWEMGLEWIDAKDEKTAAAGWCTLTAWVAITPDEKLDIKKIKELLTRIEKEIHSAQNRVCYTMNNFLIAAGGYVASLTDTAVATAEKIGAVTVDVGETSCKVPSAADYIEKMKQKGVIGKKKKTAKC